MLKRIKFKMKKYISCELYDYLHSVKMKIISLVFYFMRVFPIQANKIVMMNYYGASFGDNSKYVALELDKKSEEHNYDIVWIANDPENFTCEQNIRVVRNHTFKAIYELATAKVWLDNCRKESFVRKRKKQYYINTGHGGVPLKKVEKDAGEKVLGSPYVEMAKNDSKMCDLMVSHCNFKTNILKQSYWYDGEVLECGIPKIETLLLNNKEAKKKVYEYFHLTTEKIVLYAPTFRNDKEFDFMSIDVKKIIEILNNKFGSKWVFIYRMHPNVAQQYVENSYEDSLNATFYPDMQELLQSCDILITDYSGTMFETLYTSSKTILYAPDLNEYEREFYFDLHSLPFPLGRNNQELANIIEQWNEEEYEKAVVMLKQELGLIEKYGAAQKIASIIEDVIWSHEECER